MPNKATRDVRAAMAQVVEGNVERLQGWVDRVAARDPAKALELASRFAEFVVPKLARTDFSGGEPEEAQVIRVIGV